MHNNYKKKKIYKFIILYYGSVCSNTGKNNIGFNNVLREIDNYLKYKKKLKIFLMGESINK